MDVTATFGVTALWLASGEGWTEVIKILLGKGSDAGNTQSGSISCVMAASVGGHTDALGLLLAKTTLEEIHKKEMDGLTAFMNAAENGTVPFINMLLGAGAEIDVMSETRFTAYIDLTSNSGGTAIMFAASGDTPRYSTCS